MSDKDDLINRVLDEGYFVQSIAGTPIHPQPFAYTVGRTLLGRPELLVTGLEAERARTLIDEVVALDDQRPFQPGHIADSALGPCRLIACDTGLAYGAMAAFGVGRIKTMQILWPSDGAYPDTSTDLASIQPVHRIGASPLFSGYDPYKED